MPLLQILMGVVSGALGQSGDVLHAYSDHGPADVSSAHHVDMFSADHAPADVVPTVYFTDAAPGLSHASTVSLPSGHGMFDAVFGDQGSLKDEFRMGATGPNGGPSNDPSYADVGVSGPNGGPSNDPSYADVGVSGPNGGPSNDPSYADMGTTGSNGGPSNDPDRAPSPEVRERIRHIMEVM